MFTLFKVILSIPIGIGIIYSILYLDGSGGILAELKFFGPVGMVISMVVFFLLVFFYAKDLIKTLKLISPAARKAEPNSVWFMLVLPYNIIEDFFIIANVAKSLEAEAVINPALARFKSLGMVSGQGWCVAQIVSLLPNQIGSAAGLVAFAFWMWHWVFIRRVNGVLIESSGR